MFISDDSIQRIKEAVDLVDLAGSYVELKKAGKNYKACCPFHQEKTPSFIVSPDRQTFKCFGCGESGDLFAFVEKMEHVDFPEAIRRIAERYHIPVEAADPLEKEKKEKRNRLCQINQKAMLFYYKNLLTERRPQQYLKSRKMTAKIINPFMLGYADGKGDSLYQYLKQFNVDHEDLLALGLVSPSHSGKGYYDKFRNRLIFPILSIHNEVIGFGGRIIGDGQPKYLNSQESEIFHKGKNLYGLHLLGKRPKHEKIVMVEGYMDVVGLYECGIDYALASLGTSLTLDQARLIGRYTDQVYLCYDGDSAGIKASRRAVEVFRQANIRPRLILLPGGMDPDEYALAYGKEGFEKEIEEAVDPIDFELRILRAPYDLKEDQDRLSYVQEASSYLATVEGEAICEIYMQKVSEEAGVPLESLRQDVKELKNQREMKKRELFFPDQPDEQYFPDYVPDIGEYSFLEEEAPGQSQAPIFSLQREREELEKAIIRRLAQSPAEEKDRIFLSNFLEDPARKKVEEVIHGLWKADLSPAYSIIRERLSAQEQESLSDLLASILVDEKKEKLSNEKLRQMIEEIEVWAKRLLLKEQKVRVLDQLSMEDEQLEEKGKKRSQLYQELRELETKLQSRKGRES